MIWRWIARLICPDRALRLRPSVDDQLRNCVISGNRVDSNTKYGIYIGGEK